MASFSMEEFVGNGSLKAIVPKLLDDGWDDVPTLKLMNAEDKDAINMTQKQKDALEIRSYLHDRSLMQYADLLEASGKGLPELLSMNVTDLSTQFRFKRGHLARFLDRASSCAPPVPKSPPTVKPNEAPSRMASSASRQSPSINRKTLSMRAYTRKATGTFEFSVEQSMAELKIKDGHVFKGIVASMPAGPRGCGCVESPQVVEDVAPLSAIESISVQKLTPEYKIGIDRLVKSTTPPMKASELWRDKTAVILCLRRPGCIMCRAEAHQLYSKKPIFDALGVQLYCIIHEYIETEVKDFWPRYWGGAVIFDRGMGFFKALGGGKLLKDKFISGFLLNSQARANYKRAKATGMQNNFKGEGEIKGGLFIVGRGKTGIAYQFIERNFGDWAPLPEVLEICSRLQHMNEKKVLDAVCIEKDVDRFHPLNIGHLAMCDREPLFVPCTPKGCLELLHRQGISIKGKRAVVIGRSNIVGTPAAQLLQREDETVTVVHSRTKNPKEFTREADVIIAVVGQPNMVRGNWIKPGAVIIDVGINPVELDSNQVSGSIPKEIGMLTALNVCPRGRISWKEAFQLN